MNVAGKINHPIKSRYSCIKIQHQEQNRNQCAEATSKRTMHIWDDNG